MKWKKTILFSDIFLVIVFGIYLLITTLNNKKVENTPQNIEETEKVEDYFPIKNNIKYIYEGVGNEYASYTVQVDYTKENMIQQRINNGGSEIVKVFKISNSKVTNVFSKGEVYYRQSFLDEASNYNDILLQEPLTKGTTWNSANSTSTRTITSINADVNTPSGNYKAIEVTTLNDDGSKDINYFVKNIGLVKSAYIIGEDQITSSLSKIEVYSYVKQSINFYYPNLDENKLYFKNKEISFETNASTYQLLTDAYQQTISNAGQVFSTNTKINKLYLGNDDIVYIDLNQNFITDMNAGALYEQMILQAIANTFGKYYNAAKVILTIDDKLYESGHIAMKEGEYLTVNDTNVVEAQ